MTAENGAGQVRITILGSGSSGGVPRIGGHWGKCDPAEPRNRRRRCSLLIEGFKDHRPPENGPNEQNNGQREENVTRVLVDTAPDMREQLIDAGVGWLDGVFYTHAHADQAHGIDDLRVVAINGRRRVDVYMDTPTAEILTQRFDYCFETPPGSPYPPVLQVFPLTALTPVTVDGPGGGVTASPFLQEHGSIMSLGFRVGNIAYSSDISDIPGESIPALEGLDCWIVDALRRDPHPSHAHLDTTLEWLERFKPRLGVLTNLHVDMDYRTLCAELPDNVIPAYDGMVIDVPEPVTCTGPR
ncbi:MAG: MBL fold metallo-hydrolase [Parvularculales bacterium]